MFAPQTVMQVKKMILEGPESTKDEAEIQMYLLALKNSLLPEAVPILNRFAESEVGSYSTTALTALQRYDVSLINSEVNQGPRHRFYCSFKKLGLSPYAVVFR